MGTIITGNDHSDYRGTLTYFNNFDLGPIKRTYILEHPDTSIVRAWQAHKHENKWFHVIKGSFKMVLVKPDDWFCPSINLAFEEYILNEECKAVLHVKGGFATGFQALEAGSRLMVFSDFSTEQSLADDFRFAPENWYDWHHKENNK